MKMILIGTLIFSSFNTIPVKIMSSVPGCYWKNFKAVLETSCRLRNSVERPRKTESSLHATKCWRPCVFDVRSTLIVWSLGGGPSFKKMAVKFKLGLRITVLRRLTVLSCLWLLFIQPWKMFHLFHWVDESKRDLSIAGNLRAVLSTGYATLYKKVPPFDPLVEVLQELILKNNYWL